MFDLVTQGDVGVVQCPLRGGCGVILGLVSTRYRLPSVTLWQNCHVKEALAGQGCQLTDLRSTLS